MQMTIGVRGLMVDTWRIRYGILNYDDDILNSVFDQGENQLLLIDAGTSIYRFFDVGIGFGRSKSQGFLLSADGSVSSEVDELRVLPMSAHVTARAHLWQEQLIVPFGGYGMDYWLWKETWGGEATTDTRYFHRYNYRQHGNNSYNINIRAKNIEWWKNRLSL